MTITRDSIRDDLTRHVSGKDGVAHVRDYMKHAMFTPYAWPGGYPVVFGLSDGSILCAHCAERVFIMENEPSVWAEIHYEGPSIWCDECNAEIESAYGDPEDD